MNATGGEDAMKTIRGVIRGKTIELEQETGLCNGQAVAVSLQPVAEALPAGEGIRRSAGAWGDSAEELDAFLEWNRQQRKATRAGTES